MNNITEIIQKAKTVEEVTEYIENNNIIIKNINNKNFDIILYLIEFCSSYNIIHYFIQESQYETFNYTFSGLAFHSNQVPLFTAIIKKKFKVADLLIENGASINYCIKHFNETEINILDYFCFIRNGFELDSEQLKYILNKGYNQKITSSIITKILQYKKSNLIKIFFDHFSFSINHILDWLLIYKNRIALSHNNIQNKIDNISNRINDKLSKIDFENVIFDREYIDLNENSSQQIINLLFEYQLINNISDKHLLQIWMSAIYNNNILLINRILNYPNLNHNIKSFKNQKSFKKFLTNASQFYYVKKNNLKLITNFLLYGISTDNVKDGVIDYNLIKEFEKRDLSLIINLLIKVDDYASLQKIIENPEISSKLDLNYPDNNNEKPLITAYKLDSLKIFKYLLKHGADPNTLIVEPNSNQLLLYHALIDMKHKIVSDLLTNYHSSIFQEEMNEKNQSSFKYARSIIISNQENYSVDLIDAFYMRNKKKINSNLALPENIKIKGLWNGPIFPEKLNVSMNPLYEKLKNHFTALIFSYLIGDKEIFDILINCCNIDERDGFGHQLIYYAIIKNDLNMIDRLIKLNVDISNIVKRVYLDDRRINYEKNYSALTVSLEIGNKDIFYHILQYLNFDKYYYNNIIAEFQVSILEKIIDNPYLSLEDKYDIIKSFIEKKPLLLRYCSFNDLFANVIKLNSPTIVELLIQNGLKITSPQSKESLLEIAIKYNLFPMVQLLVKYGCEINSNIYGKRYSLLWYAVLCGNITILKLLIENGADLNIGDDITFKDLLSISKMEEIFHSEELKSILQYNIWRVNGYLIQQIIKNRKLKLLELLLESRLDVNKKDNKGNSPLAIAITESCPDIVNALIKYGADLYSINLRGKSIYDLAYDHCNSYYGRFIYDKIKRVTHNL